MQPEVIENHSICTKEIFRNSQMAQEEFFLKVHSCLFFKKILEIVEQL